MSYTHEYLQTPLLIALPDERRHRMHMLYRLLSGASEQGSMF
jgi:hypothetical protein